MGKVFSFTHRPHLGLTICLIYVAWILAACGGDPSSQVANATSTSPIVTQPTLVSLTPRIEPTTFITEPATSMPSQPTRVRPSAQPPTTMPTLTSIQTALPIGSTVSADSFDITLYNAELVEKYKSEGGVEFQQTGLKYILLTFGFKRVTLPEPGNFSDYDSFDTHAIDRDGDSYQCDYTLPGWSPVIPEGYEFRKRMVCAVPATVADALASFQATAVLGGSKNNDVQMQFSLGDRTTTFPDVPLKLNPDTIVSVGQRITVTFDNPDEALEFSVDSARWTGKNGTELMIDVTMTNPGKRGPNFTFNVIRPLDTVNRTLTEQAIYPGGINPPPFGQSKTISLRAGSMLPVDEPVPIFLWAGNKLNGKPYLIVNVAPQRK